MSTELSIWEDKVSIQQIKEIYGAKLSNGEFSTLVQMGKSTGLNPFLREIWAIKYGDNPAQIFIARDGYRKSAQLHPLYDYHTSEAVYSNDYFEVIDGEINHKYSLKDRGILLGAYSLVKRKGSSRPNFVFVELKEYTTGKSLWNTKPATMIKKVAEAQCLKMAFQELFAGTYSEDEMFEDKKTKKVNVIDLKTMKNSNLKKLEKINEEIEGEYEEVNTETGEIACDLPFVTIHDVKKIISEADTLDKLSKVRSLAKSLPEEEKKELHSLYKEKEKELS